MSLKSIFFGVAITAVLLAMLVITRMMELPTAQTEFEIREIDTVTLPEPPPPAPEVEVDEDIAPPPPPALMDIKVSMDVSQPVISVSEFKIDPELAVETFFSDQPPSPLPQPEVRRPAVKKSGATKPGPTRQLKLKHAAPPKSEYSIGELDRKPRLLRNPSVKFPSSIRNVKSGRVVVRVAILPSGRSRFISVISSSHPSLISPARRIANGSRFTPPTRHGKPVKVVMTWPITIKK